jgi:hypothetical protein
MTIDQFIERLLAKGAGDGRPNVIREWLCGHEITKDVVHARLAGMVSHATLQAALAIFDEEEATPKRGKAKATR